MDFRPYELLLSLPHGGYIAYHPGSGCSLLAFDAEDVTALGGAPVGDWFASDGREARAVEARVGDIVITAYERRAASAGERDGGVLAASAPESEVSAAGGDDSGSGGTCPDCDGTGEGRGQCGRCEYCVGDGRGRDCSEPYCHCEAGEALAEGAYESRDEARIHDREDR